ncbi:MAG: Cof-type HAD-IIB family hydrolase [Fusobacteriaceae bacterium]
MYKMIVTDLDDTLLNSEGKISKKDKDAIIRAQEAGVKFVLASGRPTYAMRDLAKELRLDEFKSYILSYNGAIITQCDTGVDISDTSLNKEEIHLLHDMSKKHDVHIITYLDDKVISETESEYIDVEVKLTGMEHKIVKCFKSAVDRDAVKCIMLGEPEYLKTVEHKLKEKLNDRFSIAISKPFFLEITKLGIDKGASLLKLAEILDIKTEEIIAVGDSYNDVTMLKVAGLSVSVANGKPEIKEMVQYITNSNEENGMSEVIEKFIFGK